MKTNKLWSILKMLVLMFCVATSFCSCGSDDDNNPAQGDSNNNDNLPSASKLFVGGWSGNTNGYTFTYIFYEDGKSIKIDGAGNYNEGSWAYIPQTGILTSTSGTTSQWQVTLSNSNEWSGYTIDNKDVRTYEKLSNKDYILKTIVDAANKNLKWKESNSGLYLSIDRDHTMRFPFMKEWEGILNDYLISPSKDDNPYDYTIPFTISPKAMAWQGAYDTGTITLQNPNNFEKRKLIIKLDKHNGSYEFNLEKI